MSAIEAQGKYETVEWQSKESYEIKLAKGIKYNPKQFCAYLYIIALHKMGAFGDAGNYRPTSLTCILCKVYEKLLFKHLYSHVKGFISLNQHGFMEGTSCLSNLSNLLFTTIYYHFFGK